MIATIFGVPLMALWWKRKWSLSWSIWVQHKCGVWASSHTTPHQPLKNKYLSEGEEISLIFIERLSAYVKPPPQHECAHPNAPLEAPLGRTAEKTGQLYLKMCSFGANTHSFLRSVASIGLIAIICLLLSADPSPCPLHAFHPQQMSALRTFAFSSWRIAMCLHRLMVMATSCAMGPMSNALECFIFLKKKLNCG